MQYLLVLLGLFFLGCGHSAQLIFPEPETFTPSLTQTPADSWFKIVILDVGQGDATLLIAPEGDTALIDTGPPQKGEEAILNTLKELGIEAIQTIFISHDHEDHVGSLEEILQNDLALESVLINKDNARVNSTITLGSVKITIKAANGQVGNSIIPLSAREDENNLSLALLVQYKNFRYFTDGDLPGGGGIPPYQTIDLETPLSPLIGDVDIILVPHHGSHTSTNQNFLDTIKPEVAILSLGDENDFFHPHPSVIKRLKEAEIKIYQTEKGWLTDTEGIEIVNDHICIVTDGETYLVKPYSVDKCAPPSLQ